MNRNLRLVKLQTATKEHECAECTDPIEAGERYMRAAIPGDSSLFPNEREVAQEEAWQYVDQDWTIEKTHELCYAKRYYRPGKYAAVTTPPGATPTPNYGGRGA